MPELPDVVPGEPVESDWGNDVRDRITQRFADATARSASLPFPQPGQVTWLDDPGTLEVFDGDWVKVSDEAAVIHGPDGTEADAAFGFTQVGNGLFLVSSNRPGITAGGELRVSFRGGTYGTGVDADSNTARDILVGTTVPDNAWGKDGDIFIRFDAP